MKRSGFDKHHLTVHAGTASVGAMIFSSDGQIKAKSFTDIFQQNPETGWVQVDPEEIWKATLHTMGEAINKASLYPEQIGALSIASERGTTMIWDRVTSQPLTPLIAQRCQRSKGIIEEWEKKKWDRFILQRTGLPLSESYSAPKMVWLFGHYPSLPSRARKGEVLFGGLDSWLLWNMTLGKVHATDYTGAAATMLYHVRALKWDKRLLAKLKIPAAMLPEVRPSGSIFGTTEQQGSLPEGIPIAAMAADQPAALFALAGLEKGLAKASYDLDCHLMVNIGNRPKFSKTGMATTLACTTGRKAPYILEAILANGGWPVYWLRDSLHLVDGVQETSSIAQTAASNGQSAYLVPQFNNSAKEALPGGILGLRSNMGKAELVKAALESVAFETRQAVHLLSKDAKTTIRSIFVDGPMSQNDFLLQFQANISNLDIARVKLRETACLGVSCLAGLAVKQYKSLKAVQRLRPIDQHFRCRFSSGQRKKALKGWELALKKVRK